MDARHKAGHDDVKNRLSAHQTFKQPHLRVLATNFARALRRLSSLKTRGSRECRAFGSPAASYAKKKAYELVTTGPPKRSGIPCAMALRLIPRSLRRSGFLVTVASAMRKHRRQLNASVEASRPRGFVVRERRIRLVRHPRPSPPASNVRDDRDTPLMVGTGCAENAFDLPDVTSEMACDRLTRQANQLEPAKLCQGQSSRVADADNSVQRCFHDQRREHARMRPGSAARRLTVRIVGTAAG